MVAKLMERVFEFLDRFYLKNEKKDFLGVTAMKIFIEYCYTGIKNKLLTAVKHQFELDRNGTAVDQELLQRVIKCFVDMGM